MKKRSAAKTVSLLLLPLLLFAVLIVPYSHLNSQVIVEIFGCGCPKIDTNSEIIYPDFNANDFTALFWLFISLCVTVISVIASIKLIPKNKAWLRIIYVIIMFALSLFISYNLYQSMMWD